MSLEDNKLLQAKIKELEFRCGQLTTENVEIRSDFNNLQKDHCRLQELEDISAEEERMNLEMAFLEEEKDFFDEELKKTRRLLFKLQQEFDATNQERIKLKESMVKSELDASKEIEGYISETSRLLEDKRVITKLIQGGTPPSEFDLKRSLARTDAYLALKIENNQLKQELKRASSKNFAQDNYIAELESLTEQLGAIIRRSGGAPISTNEPRSLIGLSKLNGDG